MASFTSISIALLGLAPLCSAGSIDVWQVAQGTCGWGASLGSNMNKQQCAEAAVNKCPNGFFYHSPNYPSWGCGCCTGQPNYSATHANWRVWAFGENYGTKGARFWNGLEHTAGPAHRCVDGTISLNNFCHNTGSGSNPWLRIDLGETKSVQRVLLTNRIDCCSYRLGTHNIYVGDDPNSATANTLCYQHTADTSNVAQVTATCNSAVAGRYVYVYLPGDRIINLAEVQVYSYFDTSVMHYVGCYNNAGGQRVDGHDWGFTAKDCSHKAFRQAREYFGLECPQCTTEGGDSQCLVLDQVNWTDKRDDSECEVEIDADGNRLGAGNRIALYTHSRNTETPTGAPTTKQPTAAPTTGEFYAEQMTMAALQVHEWSTGRDNNNHDFYKCHDFKGCFVSKFDARDSFEITERPDGVDFSPATTYAVADGSFSVDAEKITFTHTNGESASFPYDCSC